ncbi:tripartite tricarboxylate transporter TctB family protein [Rhodospirillaceae bacterium SYSU D60014]|uniref:tripartite tricarboxylate transporter TctB family protein n=1 Tax=Virgifigura deserti TaxID=2268457 RepID=UPI000E667811
MNGSRLRAALPYAALLVVAGLFYLFAGRIEYSHRPGALGPDFWPKLASGLMAAVCIYEIVKALWFGGGGEAHGIADALEGSEGEEQEEGEAVNRHLPLLVGGGILTVAYGALLPVFGFVLGTFLFLVAFMYLGRYRAHLVIWMASIIGTLIVAVIFLKVVYVSLPRGVPPFDRVTDAFINLF